MSRETAELEFNRLFRLEANKYALSEGAVTPSMIDARDFDWCLSFLTADQKPVFLLSEKDLQVSHKPDSPSAV